jgi:hypothetical protein
VAICRVGAWSLPLGWLAGAALADSAAHVGRCGWDDLIGCAREFGGCDCVGRQVVIEDMDALVVAPLVLQGLAGRRRRWLARPGAGLL